MTMPPAKIKEFDPATLEKIAYTSVKPVPTREPNDQYRLGYCIWQWLGSRTDTIGQAVKNSGARILVSESDAVKTITLELQKAGIEI